MKKPTNLKEFKPGDIVFGLHSDGFAYADAVVHEDESGRLYVVHEDAVVNSEFIIYLDEFKFLNHIRRN